jgi:8-hydroxy-5-deazaflavin:NADPH oxidoreductase
VAKIIGFIGGTGPEGRGLAARFAMAGLDVVIGSRSAERGEDTAKAVLALGGGSVSGGSNQEAARAEIVVVTLPYAGQAETLAALRDQLRDHIVISTVVPMQFQGRKVDMLTPPAGSAAQEAQQLLPDSRVVAAFQTMAANKLLDVDNHLEGDVIVCSDDTEALQEVIALAQQVPHLRGIDGGPLACSRYVEGITTLLVHINRKYKTETHVRIIGI